MSQLDKLFKRVLEMDPNLRFDELCKILIRIGYIMNQPKGGSSHYTFRKSSCKPITIPKHTPLKRTYIELVSEAIKAYSEGEDIE